MAACLKVGWKVTLLMDSGIRAGADAVIALSLGADLCLVVKPYLYGRVALVIRMLRNEMERTMQLLGVSGTADLQARGEELVVPGGGARSGMASW